MTKHNNSAKRMDNVHANSMKGMSTAEDLLKVWNKFKSDTEPDLIVDWNFHNPEFALYPSKQHPHGVVYIMNLRSLYNPNVPGHWVALIKIHTDTSKDSKAYQKYGKIYYYDPFGGILPQRGVNKLDCRYIYESINKEQNFTGDNSDSCGYYCIMYLLAFLRKNKNTHLSIPHNYVIFDKYPSKNYPTGRFIDTQPNNVKFKINFDAIQKELISNLQSSKM